MKVLQSALCGATLAATLAVASAAHAQLTASVEAFAGYYRPFGRFESPSNYSTRLPSQASDLRGPAWGAAAHLGLGGRFGVAADAAVTSSHELPEIVTPGGPGGPTSVNVILGSLLAQYDLSPRPSAYRVWLNAGPAVIHHGGDAYNPYGGPTSFGGALGVTVVVPLRRHLGLSADARGLFYRFDLPARRELGTSAGSLQHGNQRDALLRLGLAWTPL